VRGRIDLPSSRSRSSSPKWTPQRSSAKPKPDAAATAATVAAAMHQQMLPPAARAVFLLLGRQVRLFFL
jgi:hypothetical protein